MSGKMIMLGVVTLMGAALAFLNIWLFLLERESRPLMWAGLGILFVVGGLLNIRRERLNRS